MATSRVVAGRKNGQPQGGINSHLGQSLGKSSNSIPGSEYSKLDKTSEDVTDIALNGLANSGSSVGTSSMVTDENSPVSLSPNTVSGSSGRDGQSLVQRGTQPDQISQMPQELRQHGPSVTLLTPPQNDQVSFPLAVNMSRSSITEYNQFSPPQKKQCFDFKQENIGRPSYFQQTNGQNPYHMPPYNLEIQLLLQEEKQRQQNQLVIQSMSHAQRAQLQQEQQKYNQLQQLRNRAQQQDVQRSLSIQPPSTVGVCSRRLMQYLYHQRQRPAINTIEYWRNFIKTYYSPRGKKKWCLSLYRNVGQHAFGVFSQSAIDAWRCDLCGSKSGKGFESSFEVLPRLNEIKYGCGVIDELLYLDLPHESRLDSGLMKLEYGRAVQETVYDKTRVVREGQLRIIFDRELKILSWEFCARSHEEFIPTRLVAPKVKEMVNAALKCQSAITESGSDGVSQEVLEKNSNMFVAAGRELSKTLDTPSLNEMGFSKRYVRSLQISEVVNSMKDLIDFSARHKAGPIESLKNYGLRARAAKFQMQKMQEAEQFAILQGLPTDRNTLNKLVMTMNPDSMNIASSSGPAGAATFARDSYPNLLLRQNSITSSGSLQREAVPSFNKSNPGPSPTFQNTPFCGFRNAHLLPEQQEPILKVANLLQQNQPQHSRANQALQQQFNQMNNNGSIGQNANGNIGSNSGSYPYMSGSIVGAAPNSINSFSGTTSYHLDAGSNQNTQNLNPTENNVDDDEFTAGFLNNDFDENMD